MPKMGLEGIVSKRKDSTYRSGRSPDWFKIITELDLHDRSGQTLPLALVPVRVVFEQHVLEKSLPAAFLVLHEAIVSRQSILSCAGYAACLR